MSLQRTQAWEELSRLLGELGGPELQVQALASVATVMREQVPHAGAAGWKVYNLADAYAPREPVEYAIQGLFRLPSVNIVYAPPGSFKTLLMADAAASVAAGHGWLPPLPGKDDPSPLATLQSPVLWVDFDNGAQAMHERIEAVARGHGLEQDAPLFYVSMPSPWLDASDLFSVECLGQRAIALGARLIVIDNLRDVSGKADENSAEMATVMSNFRRLAEDTEAAVILVHHQRKATGFNSRSGDTLRGHSSIEAALDLALLIEREEHADTLKVCATKVRGADVLPFGAVFAFDHKPGTDELHRVMFYGLAIEDTFSDAAVRRAVLEVVGRQPDINKGALKKVTKEEVPDVGINRIANVIDYLTAKGELAMAAGEYGAKLYSLPGKE